MQHNKPFRMYVVRLMPMDANIYYMPTQPRTIFIETTADNVLGIKFEASGYQDVSIELAELGQKIKEQDVITKEDAEELIMREWPGRFDSITIIETEIEDGRYKCPDCEKTLEAGLVFWLHVQQHEN